MPKDQKGPSKIGHEDNDAGEIQLGKPATFEFLTFTDLSQTTDRKTKSKVRSHVMHGIQRSIRNKRPKKKDGPILLDISALSQADATPPQFPANSISCLSNIPHPLGLGAGQSDPFKQYPIDMSVRTNELFDHLHGNTCPMFKTLNMIGFFRTVLDEAAFRQILCTSSSHISMLREGPQTQEAIALSTEAIRSVNRRIADPVQCLSDGVITTVLAFACHAVMFNDVQGVLTHFNGLEEIIRRRGGLHAFKSNPVVRMVLFWIDVNTAFFHDRPPRFPVPIDILPSINIGPLTLLPNQPLLDSCVTDEMNSAIYELLVLIQYMVSALAVRDLWDDGVFAGLHVVPLMSKFLSIHHDISESSPALAREESCRLGALLYLGGIRRRFGVNLTPDVYIPKLKKAIISQDNSNAEINPVLLWLLVIGGIQSLAHEDHPWFVTEASNLIIGMEYSTWEELMTAVRTVSWVDGILQVECEKFRMEVASELWNSYGYFWS